MRIAVTLGAFLLVGLSGALTGQSGAASAQSVAASASWEPLGQVQGRLSKWVQGIEHLLPIVSGRVTAIAVSPACTPGRCRVWLGAADGGVWRTDHALAQSPSWTPIDTGLGSQAIGSLVLDPNDPTHRTVFAGTGEANGNGGLDAEAGVGLYRSVNGGDTWSLVGGSRAVSYNASIGAIAIEPRHPSVIWLGTDFGVRGTNNMYSPTPFKVAPFGLYRSTDGGAHFSLQTTFGKGRGSFDPGVTGLTFDPARPDTLWASTQGAGVWRLSRSLDRDSRWHKIFASNARSQVGLASGRRAWIIAGTRSTPGHFGEVFRIDNANAPHGKVAVRKVSSRANGASGFCGNVAGHDQCGYDEALAVDPAHPDTLWIGGIFNFHDTFAQPGGSNGRILLRTVNAGRTWTDLSTSSSNETRGIHADIHAIALDPSRPNIGFVGTDGGIFRTSGRFAKGTRHTMRAGKPCATALCRQLLSAIPTKWIDMNAGLDTLQFQKVSIPNNASGDVQGGTQDNGTWEFNGQTGQWLETLGGDGGFSAIDATDPTLRLATQFGASLLWSPHSAGPNTWRNATHNLSSEDANIFKLVPVIADPVRHDVLFAGTNQIWRSTGWGRTAWTPLGPSGGSGVVITALARAASDQGTLWVGDNAGDLVLSQNIDSPDSHAVNFSFMGELKNSPLPSRMLSGIAVDPANPAHVWVSYSGYNTFTPRHPGHVFSVWYDPKKHAAQFFNMSGGIGDQPVDDVAYDPGTGDLYAGTDFGVLRWARGSSSWRPAGVGLPIVPVYGLTVSPQRHTLYAATHGRGIYTLQLPPS